MLHHLFQEVIGNPGMFHPVGADPLHEVLDDNSKVLTIQGTKLTFQLRKGSHATYPPGFRLIPYPPKKLVGTRGFLTPALNNHKSFWMLSLPSRYSECPVARVLSLFHFKQETLTVDLEICFALFGGTSATPFVRIPHGLDPPDVFINASLRHSYCHL
jgi:hypothetical protein